MPGEPVEYRIELGPVGIRIPRGYRLRVDIASSDFPMWDRNLNSGGPIGKEGASAGRVAVQTVFHDGEPAVARRAARAGGRALAGAGAGASGWP